MTRVGRVDLRREIRTFLESIEAPEENFLAFDKSPALLMLRNIRR
ncbi:MAG: hypothetical protein ACYS1A_06610 [Planctomycetota bacterium]|jgi:hypothetical protein